MEEILRLFPHQMNQQLSRSIHNRWTSLQEIRIRIYQPIELVFDPKVEWIQSPAPTPKEMNFMINQLSEFSLYRLEDELREGYITIEGGHRVGLAGKVNTSQGKVKAIKDITFLNIRIARENIGTARQLIPYIRKSQDYLNTLLIGPPLSGKTTLLRDLARIIASGSDFIHPKKVGIVDERSEIAASLDGIPQHNIGLRADVLDACPKAEGMMMLIRSMSPEILIVDEIGSDEDVQAILEAIHSGVGLICTIHGQSLDELKKRPSLQPIFANNIFQRYIVLDRGKKPGSIKGIYNTFEKDIFKKSGVLPK